MQEEAAAKAVSGVPPAPATADSIDSERSLSKFQLFVPCTAEDVTNGSMEGVSDPQPSPENLRQHQEDQSSLDISDNEDVVREDATEPTLVLFEDKNTAYEETLSPGLDSNNTDVESGSGLNITGLLTTLFVCISSASFRRLLHSFLWHVYLANIRFLWIINAAEDLSLELMPTGLLCCEFKRVEVSALRKNCLLEYSNFKQRETWRLT